MRLMTAYVGIVVLAALSTGSFAGEYRKDAMMQVKPDSIWFQDTTRLTHWQELKKSGNSAALASYQDEVLSQRDAWKFVQPLTVRILGYEPGKNQVNVEMKTSGRMAGTTWWLDADAFVECPHSCRLTR